MSRHLAATAALLLSASGCIPAYVNPTRDDAATVTFLPDTTSNLFVAGFVDGKACRQRLNVAGKGNLTQKTAIQVVPDQEFTALASFSSGNWHCNIAMTFLPRPKGVYGVVLAGDAQKCKMGVVVPDGKKFVAEPTARARRWKAPIFSDSEAQCD
jgi:hypothetical protein